MDKLDIIDFNKFYKKDDKYENYAIAEIFNREIIYNKNTLYFIFSKTNLSFNIKDIKSVNSKSFLINPEVKKFLDNHSSEELVKKEFYYNKATIFLHPKMFPFVLYYSNKPLFYEYIHKTLTGKNYIEDMIEFNKYFKSNFDDNISLSNYLGIDMYYEHKSDFIAFQSLYNAYNKITGLNKSNLYNSKKLDKLKTIDVIEQIKLIEANIIGYNTKDIVITDEIFNKYYIKIPFKGAQSYFIHQKLIYPILCSFGLEEFLNCITDYFELEKRILDVKSQIFSPKYSIKLVDSLIININDVYALTEHGEIPLLFNKGTNYFNANYTAELLNSSKNKNLQRFFEKEDTKEFIKILTKELEESGDKSLPYYKENANPKRMQEMQQLENYFNNKILNDNVNKLLLKYPSININNVLIWKKIYSGGYYLHVDMFLLFIFWIDSIKAIEFSRLLNVILQRNNILHNTNEFLMQKEYYLLKKTIESQAQSQKIIEENFTNIIFNISSKNTSLSIQNEELEKVIKGLRNTPIAHNKGDIKFRYLEENIFSAYARNYKLPLENKTKDFCFTSYYSKELLIIFSKYIKQFPQDYVEIINKNKFKISNIEKVKNLLNDLLTGNVIINEKNWCLYEEIEKHKQLSNINNKNGKLLEDYVALIDTNNILWKCLSIVWKSNFGLPDQDIGVDLVNIKEKKIFQCKNYINSKLRLSDLSTTLRTYDIIREFDSEYKLVLVVNDNTIIDDLIPSSFEILRINSDFINIFE